MDRADMVDGLRDGRSWDIVIIGGGATGLGAALDGASRGYDVALLEQSDFAKATSSRSTKLVHGGVRYLQQGNVSLVMDALRERGIMRRNAPHLVDDLAFIVPSYAWWESPFYGIGLKVYDMLAGRYGFGRSTHLSREQVVEAIPSIRTEGLLGGTRYFDGQFDDARFAVNLAQTAAEQGAVVVNYVGVESLLKDDGGYVCGVVARDMETDAEIEVRGRVVINATGPFADEVRRMDEPGAPGVIAPSQGAHIVLDQSFLPGDSAIMVPHTDDGRVMFAIPWHDVAVVGTTDVALDGVSLEPAPTGEEIDFILETANRYLARPASRGDIRSVFAGIRPLVTSADAKRTSSISRDHTILISPTSGLVTIAGGKWTTYRKMAEDVIDQASTLADLESRPCVTERLSIHGAHHHAEQFGPLAPFGADAPSIESLQRHAPRMAERLHPDLSLTRAEVIWACRHEMARTVDDVLARRSRSLLLDAKAAAEAADQVAAVMAVELGHDEDWAEGEVGRFRAIAGSYQV